MKAKHRFMSLLIVVIMAVASGCQANPSTPSPGSNSNEVQNIQVEKVNAQKTLGITEEFPLPNCGGTGRLTQSLGTQVSVSKSVQMGTTLSVSGGAEVGVSAAAKLSLETAVEAAYRQEYDTANSRLDTIGMEAAPKTHVIYTIEWEKQEFSSVITSQINREVVQTPYTFTMNVPKIAGSREEICPVTSLPNVPGGEIVVIVKDTSGFWQNVGKGADDAQKELQNPNLKVTFFAASSFQDANGEIDIIKQAVSRDVKAIVIAAIDDPGVLSEIKTAENKGIKIVLIDSNSGTPPDYVSFLATDNRAAGAACAKELIDRIKEKTGSDTGKIAIISYIKGAGDEPNRVGGFKDYISANSHLEIISTQFSNGDVSTATRQTLKILSDNPDIVGIFGANEPSAVGMGYGIAQAGLAGKIVAIGFDGNSIEQGFIKDGTLQAIAIQSSYNSGYLGVKTAYDVAFLGRTVPKTIDTGIFMVTRDNIDSQEAKKVLY